MKILITGAASGIAYLTALTLAERDHMVYLTCHSKKEVINVEEKVKDYKNIKVMKIDITSKEDRKRVLELDIDCLYNNVGASVSGSILEANMEDVRKIFEVNVFSSFSLIKEVLKKMVKKDKGRIVIMSSLANKTVFPFMGVYSASKASISSMTKALQKELFLMESNVSVTLIEPGLYHTGFNNYMIDSKYDDGPYFKDVKDIYYELEHSFLKVFEKKKLDSIVVQIVRAIEDEKPKKVYRAPICQSFLSKIYSMFN